MGEKRYSDRPADQYIDACIAVVILIRPVYGPPSVVDKARPYMSLGLGEHCHCDEPASAILLPYISTHFDAVFC